MNMALILREVERTVTDLDRKEAEAACRAELETLLRADPNCEVYAHVYDIYDFTCIDLAQIRVRKDAPSGTGSRFMEKLCALADRYGRWITLSPGQRGDGDSKSVWKKTTSQSRLMRWYSSMGFRRNSSKGLYQLRGTMHRRPK